MHDRSYHHTTWRGGGGGGTVQFVTTLQSRKPSIVRGAKTGSYFQDGTHSLPEGNSVADTGGGGGGGQLGLAPPPK